MTVSHHTTSERGSTRSCLIALQGGPKSSEAIALVEHLLQHVVLGHREGTDHKKAAGPATIGKLRRAVGALVADLLNLARLASNSRPAPSGAHGLSPSDFPASLLGFGRDIFRLVIGSFEANGFLDMAVGKPRWGVAFGEVHNLGGSATAFALTPRFLEVARDLGVTPDAWRGQWRLSERLPAPPIGQAQLICLRARKERVGGTKQPAEDMDVNYQAPMVQQIVQQMDDLNGYLVAQDIDGLLFRGMRRIFNDGDQPGFSWNKGGRFYSLPGSQAYERWNAKLRQGLITINGEQTIEVDLRASHLTLLHALLREPLDTEVDPYGIPDWPRQVVKLWIAQAIGSGNPRPRTWSRSSQKEFEAERPGQFLEDCFPIREVGAAAKAKHPLLVALDPAGITTLDLQYHEAEVLRLAMQDLMLAKDIPVLPIHDALLVSQSHAKTALEALKIAFGDYVEGVTGLPPILLPRVTLKGA